VKITVEFDVRINPGYSERKLPEAFHQYLMDMLYIGVNDGDDYFWTADAQIAKVEDE
jgi:hypothetical protein